MAERLNTAAQRIAQEVLDGRTPLVLGCRRLFPVLAQLGLQDEPELMSIAVVDRETRDLAVWPQERAAEGEPTESQRHELDWAERAFGESVRQACATIVATMSQQGA